MLRTCFGFRVSNFGFEAARIAAALILIASVVWALRVNAADLRSDGLAAPGRAAGGATHATAIASGTSSVLYARTRPQPRIVNGVDTFDYPPVGALLYTNEDGSGLNSWCSATLIGCQTVLTAAHCVCFYPPGPDNPEPVTLMGPLCITLGVAEAARPRLVFSLPDAGEFHAAAVSVHPEPRYLVGGDLAVLHLDRPVTGIAPAAISTEASPAPGISGTIVGFGSTTADGGKSNAEGRGIKRTGRIVTDACEMSGAHSDTHVCWLFDEPVDPPGEDSDTCYGDSGGALFVNAGAGEGTVLAGVTSGGSNENCAPPDEAYDVDVFAHLSWIESTAGADLTTGPCGPGPQVGDPDTQRETWAGTLEPEHNADDYSVEVPASTAQMRIALNHQYEAADSATCPPDEPRCPNEFALYANFDGPAGPADFDCADAKSGPFHYCEIEHPQAGTWHLQVLRSIGAGPYQLTVNTLPNTSAPCTGDCDSHGSVTVDELVKGVNIALGTATLAQCQAFDCNGNGQVTVDCLVQAVNAALGGCGG